MNKYLKTLHVDTRNRLRISRTLLLSFFALLYVILFTPPHTSDDVVLPVWVTPPLTADSATTSVSSAASIPFLYNRLFGYISTSGEITTLFPVSYGVAYSGEYYSPYDQLNHPIPIHRSDGETIRTIDRYGYPLIDQDRIFILHQNGNSVSEWSRQIELWRRDFGAVISAIDVKQTLAAISFFDGHAVILDQDGNQAADLAHPVAKGHVFSAIALTDDQRMCVVYEVTKNQLFIFALDDEEYTLIRTIDMHSTENTYAAFPYLAFLPDSNNITYYDGINFYFYDFAASQTRLLHRAVSLLDIDMNNSYLAVITRDIAQTLLSVYTADGTSLLRTPLIDTSSVSDHFVRFSDQNTRSLMLGVENRIIAFQHQEQP